MRLFAGAAAFTLAAAVSCDRSAPDRAELVDSPPPRTPSVTDAPHAPSPSPRPTAAPLHQIYNNSRFGFSLFAPASWRFAESANGDGAFATTRSPGVEVQVWGEPMRNRLRAIRPYRDEGFDIQRIEYLDGSPGYSMVRRSGGSGVVHFFQAREALDSSVNLRVSGPLDYLYENFFLIAAMAITTRSVSTPATPAVDLAPVVPHRPSYFIESAPKCHPSYDQRDCLPLGVDHDCSNNPGEDNGPMYIDHPIRVFGPDEYGLDRNGDGVGCEPV